MLHREIPLFRPALPRRRHEGGARIINVSIRDSVRADRRIIRPPGPGVFSQTHVNHAARE